MPAIIVFLWFSLYMFLVFRVSLNMLLAIITEHYTCVTEEMRQLLELPTPWEENPFFGILVFIFIFGFLDVFPHHRPRLHLRPRLRLHLRRRRL